jgi:XRE family transcriptional regulator, regulator of sulfur utilization
VAAKATKTGEIFGARLRELRLARGLTQPQLAERCGSNVPFISNVERGVMLPGLAMILRFAAALECRVTDLVDVFDTDKPRKRK